jgi:folate-binding protein YgfZ
MTASVSNSPVTKPDAGVSPTDPQLRALLETAGVSKLGQGWIRVTGSDRVRWLNGMATNAVQQLAMGQGSYNFFLNAQGRIQADGNIFATADALLIETSEAAKLLPYLDHYVIMDDVELTDITPSRYGVQIVGPQASELLSQLGIPQVDLAEDLSFSNQTWNDSPIKVIRGYSPLVSRFELWCETTEAASALGTALEQAGAVTCDASALEQLRVLEGTPRYGVDIRDRDLPQETNQTRALHFAKGCYLGQEIVERIRSRGNVHRTFSRFRLEGELPAAGTALEADGKAVGELTSVTTIETVSGKLQAALGYARREALERHETLSYAGGVARAV